MRRITLLVLLLGLVAATGSTFAADVEGTDGYSDPFLIKSSRVTPDYPPAALAARYGASVTVMAHVKADGTVLDAQVVDSSRPKLGFEDAAVEAVRQWRFHPATKGGEVVDSVTVFSLDFSVPGTRSRPNPYVHTGFVTSNMAFPGIDSGAGRPDGTPGRPLGMPDLSTTAVDEKHGLTTPSLPPCSEVGCMYDRSKLLPPQRGTIDTGGGFHPNPR